MKDPCLCGSDDCPKCFPKHREIDPDDAYEENRQDDLDEFYRHVDGTPRDFFGDAYEDDLNAGLRGTTRAQSLKGLWDDETAFMKKQAS